jgi:radical SAM superfamily enzyme YgiQ (UPF0313 family)
MKILIINLPRYGADSVTREGRCELIEKYRIDTPATLLIIASILRESNYQIDFIDANGLNLGYKFISKQIKKKEYNCIIFTFISKIIDQELKFCKIVKNLNSSCITIGYSWYAKDFGKEILNEYHNLDILIIEDPFSVIENLIEILSKNESLNNIGGIAYRDINNQINVNPKLDSRKNFDDLPLPAYDLLSSFKPYYIYSPLLRPYALVYSGKGCPFGCRYCNVARTKYSGRSAENIIKELKLLKKLGNVKYIWFFDEIFTINRNRVIKICKAIIKEKLKIKWLCDSRVDLVDKDLLKLMRKAGCIGISYGVESGGQTILNSMNKGISVEQAKNALKWTRKTHIPIQLNLILGYVGENEKTLKETESFVRTTLPEFLQITKMLVLRNTEFNILALEKGWLSEDLNWKTNLTVPHKKLKNYLPYELSLWEEKSRIHKMLYYNPKWWVICIKTLIMNPKLFIPIIGIFLNNSQSISLIK